MKTFDYKPSEFYTQYFEKHPDFKVLEEFRLSDDKDQKNTFVGRIEVLNCIHPLELRVEIPMSFPHHKLTFRTKSLSGYPHLIHTGKIKYGDWFCLNTPFAETAEEQLNQEILRLTEWININLREDIPAIIKDEELKKALFTISCPEWMNPDDIKEVETKARMTFIGEFAEDKSDPLEAMGKFHCIKTPDHRLYAFKDKYRFTKFELPYIIVDPPQNPKILDDFISLRDYYGWDESICAHLLSGYKVGERLNSWYSLNDEKDLDLNTTLQHIDNIRTELAKENPSLRPERFNTHSDSAVLVPFNHRDLILRELDVVEKKVKEDQGIKAKRNSYNINPEDWTEEDWEEQAQIDEWIDRGRYIFDYFVLGLKFGSKILWMIFYTNHALLRFEQKRYNIEIGEVMIDTTISLELGRSMVQTIDESMFFGRGAICDNIRKKKIALIGLGAIGSMVAEALAHSGIRKIGLWDSDVVEPGNICRSTYCLQDIGDSKVQVIAKRIRDINPFIESEEIVASGRWEEFFGPNDVRYKGGSFYDNINYSNQGEALKKIRDYDLIIDCTGRNEILHFISYSLPNKDIISIAITNKARELLCISNKNGNAFELRKTYLSAIAQDTKDFYVEGSGCYDPTFKATYFDVCSLVNLCIKELNSSMNKGKLMSSTIFKCNHRGIIADRLHTYRLKDSDIMLNIPNEVMLDAEDLPDSFGDYLGFILGGYSKDGKQIMITNIVEPANAKQELEYAFSTSKGIIDYIGDVAYSNVERGTFKESSLLDISAKAQDEEINTNNPLLAIKNPDGDITFFLFINGGLIPFIKADL